MRNAIFDIQAFADLTNELMTKSPDRARAVMVENNAYYLSLIHI